MKLTVQGREAYAYTGGKSFDASLPTIAFVHGALNDHSVWTLLARWAAHHGFGVLALDLPGHMRSAGPALTSVEAMADWLLAALDAAGVQTSRTRRPQPRLAGRARSRGARARSRHAVTDVRHRRADAGDRCVAQRSRDAPHKAIDMVVTYSFSTLAAKPSYPGPGVWLRGSARGLMRQVLAQVTMRCSFTPTSRPAMNTKAASPQPSACAARRT